MWGWSFLGSEKKLSRLGSPMTGYNHRVPCSVHLIIFLAQVPLILLAASNCENIIWLVDYKVGSRKIALLEEIRRDILFLTQGTIRMEVRFVKKNHIFTVNHFVPTFPEFLQLTWVFSTENFPSWSFSKKRFSTFSCGLWNEWEKSIYDTTLFFVSHTFPPPKNLEFTSGQKEETCQTKSVAWRSTVRFFFLLQEFQTFWQKLISHSWFLLHIWPQA